MARAQDLTIYTGTQFSVVHSLNYGDPLSSKADLYLDDVYRLKTKAQPTRLTLQTAATGRRHFVAPHSAIGAIGEAVHLDCQITLISDAGHDFNTLIFVEVELGEIKQVYLSAFAMLQPDTDYRLICIDRHVDPAKLVELNDPAFLSWHANHPNRRKPMRG